MATTLATSTPKTSWASTAHLFLKEASSPEEVLSETAIIFAENNSVNTSNGVYDLGSLDEDGFSISAEDGDVLELKDINGVLLDRLQKEGTISPSFTIIKPSEQTKGFFWDIDSAGTDGTADHLKVLSLLTTKHYVLAFGNVGANAEGTEAVIFPYCSVTANPVYTADKGWTLECSAYAIRGGNTGEDDTHKKFLFDFVTLTKSLLGITEA